MIDLSMNEPTSPLPASWLHEALCDHVQSSHRYPEVQIEGQLFSETLHHHSRTIPVLTRGVDHAIDLVSYSMNRLGMRPLIIEPAFFAFSDRFERRGIDYDTATVDLCMNHGVLEDSLSLTALTSSHILFIASPDNPTGHTWSPSALANMSARVGYMFVDMTYSHYVSHPSLPSAPPGNMFLYHSFSKAMRLASHRLGVLGCPITEAPEVTRLTEFKHIDGYSKRLAKIALRHHAQLSEDARDTVRTRERTRDTLLSYGYSVLPSDGNFLTIYDPDSHIRARLACAGIRVKSPAHRALSDWLRMSIGSDDVMDIVLRCLKTFGGK